MLQYKLKKNVAQFNSDVLSNEGYKYTAVDIFSAIVANKRLTEATLENIDENCTSIFDIGCGDGTYTFEIKKVFPNATVYGTDPAIEAVMRASAKYTTINFFVSNILRLDTIKVSRREFDLAIVRGVLHHLSDPVTAIRNCMQFSKRLLIIEPNGNNPLLKIIEKTSRYHIDHEERSFSSRSLRHFCRMAGCKIVKLYFVGFVPFFFPEWLARPIYFFQPFLEKMPFFNMIFTAQTIILCEKA